MREINLDANVDAKAPRHTYLAYGPTGSGKTTWAASFPRPIFLSDTTESGYESLRGLDPSCLFEPEVRPIIFGIERMNDMARARELFAPYIRAGMIQTVVIDSLTFYADLYLNFIFEMQGASQNNLKAYGALGQHLRALRVGWHQMGCNVVSLCLANEPNEDQPNGQPLIPGKEASKFGAGCDFLLYLRHDRFKQAQQFVENFELHSKPFGKYVARARRAIGMTELPSPLLNSDYTSLITTLGYDAEATRAALPKYVRPQIVIMQDAPTAPIASAQANTGASGVRSPAAGVKPHVPNAARPAAAPNGASAPSPSVTRRPAVVPARGNTNNS